MWSKERLEERSKVLFNSPWVSPELNARNQQEWIKAVERMGEKFAYAVQVERKTKFKGGYYENTRRKDTRLN